MLVIQLRTSQLLNFIANTIYQVHNLFGLIKKLGAGGVGVGGISGRGKIKTLNRSKEIVIFYKKKN